MKKYRVVNICSYLERFKDEEIEAENSILAKECIYCEILEDLGIYIDIEVEEVEENSEEQELDYADEYHELEVLGELE